MKKGIKIALILAAILIVAGIGAIIGGLATIDFDLNKLNNAKYVTTEQTVSEPFSEIVIDCNSSNVRLLPAEDETCRVVFTDSEKAILSAAVQDGTLRITRDENRNWYDFKFFFGFLSKSTEIRVYLPAAEYESLSVKATSGDILVNGLSIRTSVNLETTSGDIQLSDLPGCESVRTKATSGSIRISGVSGRETLSAETTSGDILIENAGEAGSLTFAATSGDITVSDASCLRCSGKTTSGDIALKNVILTDSLLLEATSGDVTFADCDAESVTISTTSGEVTGSFLNEMRIRAESSSGDIIVPHSNTGGSCTISTTSGDVHVSFVNGSD